MRIFCVLLQNPLAFLLKFLFLLPEPELLICELFFLLRKKSFALSGFFFQFRGLLLKLLFKLCVLLLRLLQPGAELVCGLGLYGVLAQLLQLICQFFQIFIDRTLLLSVK